MYWLFEQKEILVKMVQKWAILLNKVKKIIRHQNFFIKSKLLRMWDLNIDFHFWAKKWLPWDFQMHLAHPWHLACFARRRMGQESQRMTFWDPFRSHHVCLSVLLVYHDFCTFLAQPNHHHTVCMWCIEVEFFCICSYLKL